MIEEIIKQLEEKRKLAEEGYKSSEVYQTKKMYGARMLAFEEAIKIVKEIQNENSY